MTDGEKSIPKIRTMRSDAEELIKEKQVSQLDISTKAYIAAGNPSNHSDAFVAQFSWIKVFAAIVLVLLLATAGYFGYRYFTKRTGNAEIVKPKPPAKLLNVDDEKILRALEATPGELISALGAERRQQMRFGSIIYFPLELTQKSGEVKFAESQDFIRALSWKPPSAFFNSVGPEFNILIVYSTNSNDLTAVFRVQNFNRALAGLFGWEATMLKDLKPFLSQEDVANSTQFNWQDEIIKNNDARVLKDKLGKAILGHAVFNKQLAIISTSRDGLALVLERLIKLPLR